MVMSGELGRRVVVARLDLNLSRRGALGVQRAFG